MKITHLFILIILILLTSCTDNISLGNKDSMVIGFSQCTMVDVWRKAMVDEMKREIVFYRDYDIRLVIKDANDNNEKQIEDIKELVESNIDLLIVSPNEAFQLTEIVEDVYNRGIPVIVIDRKINSTNYSAFIGADNLAIGREAGYFANELLKGKGKILEIRGLTGSTPAIERSKGFHEIIDRYPQLTVAKTIEGKWLEENTLSITDSLFRVYTDFNLIFAHNDFMANAASKSASKHNLKPYIIGIDGMNIPNGGVDHVIKGSIDGTIFYPTGGDKAIQIAIDILTDKPFDKNNILNTFRIDNSNARTIWLQGLLMQEQQNKIDKQNEQIDSMSSVLSRRNTLLLLTYVTIFLLCLAVVIIFLHLRHKNRMNLLLDEKTKTINQQNKIITKQRDESINLLIVAEEAKENKLRIFTDLSHEFRTIVTLITNPIKDLLAIVNDESAKTKLLLLQRSSERLSRLTEGILKFRNLDENKYQLIYVNCNISKFLENIIYTFQEHANAKNIKITSNIPGGIYAEFDVGVMEKVMYNLLSNAIKFTDEQGSIKVTLKLVDFKLTIVVQDTGSGISEKDLPFIFSRFHKISIPRNDSNEDRIGIGLPLCKELLQLHGGQISVSSTLNKGTTFTFTIPQFHIAQNIDSNEDLPTEAANKITNAFAKKYNPNVTILIVEDNPDVLILLADLISKHFKVIVASNGKEALEVAIKKSPNLIVGDILMPVMDGMQMTIELKKHLTTCHIPIILLTAIDSQENIIKGFEIGADAYITKPFNENLLISNIKNLIANREKLKNYFCPSPFFRKLLESKNNSNEEFLRVCLNSIYENLENEDYTMSSLSEKMNMSRSSLYRKIKEVSSVKPVDFLKKAKLNYAAKLLVIGNGYTVNEVAWRSGFNDPKYFSKCFIQEFGITPSQYLKEYQNNKDYEINAD